MSDRDWYCLAASLVTAVLTHVWGWHRGHDKASAKYEKHIVDFQDSDELLRRNLEVLNKELAETKQAAATAAANFAAQREAEFQSLADGNHDNIVATAKAVYGQAAVLGFGKWVLNNVGEPTWTWKQSPKKS